MSTFATLRALHAIIGSALDDIERVYADASSAHARPSPPFSPSALFSPSTSSAFSPSTPFSPSPSPAPFSPAQHQPYRFPPLSSTLQATNSYPSPPSPDPSPISPTFSAPWTTASDLEPDLSDTSSRRSSLYTLSSARSSPEPELSEAGAVPSTPGRPRAATTADADVRTPSARARAMSYESPWAPLARAAPMTPHSPWASSGLLPPFPSVGPVPTLDFPALGAPFYASAQDAGVEGEARRRAEELTNHPSVIGAVNRIVAACGQMGAAVQRPFLTLADAAMGYHLPSCLRFLEESHAVEILHEAGRGGLRVDELASRIDDLRGAPAYARVDPGQLSHILRLLATHHIGREVRPDVFANNRVSAAMDSGASCASLKQSPEKKYEGTDGVAAFVGLCTDELFKASAYLTDVYLPAVTSSQTPPPSPISSMFAPMALVRDVAPVAAPRAPFNMAFHTAVPYFEWLERPGNERRLRRFGPAMTGTGRWEVPGAVLAGFPWQSLKPGAVVVDVGGGIGSASMLLSRAFDHLRFVIQDRPQVAAMGEEAWRSRCPELLDSGRTVFVGHDFFLPQPALPACMLAEELAEEDGSEQGEQATEQKAAVFLLRVITHDWEDEYVTRILLRLRLAAGPETKLLLADYVLPLACADEDGEDAGGSAGGTEKAKERLPGSVRTLAPEGSPLLPNLGKAHANAYWLDMTMRATFNAQERTLRELTALTLTAGWRVVRVTCAEGSVFGHIIAEPVDIPPGALELLDLPLPGAGALGEEADETRNNAVRGDTFGSQKTLPSEDVLRRGARRKGAAVAGARRVGGGAGLNGAKVLRKRRSTLRASIGHSVRKGSVSSGAVVSGGRESGSGSGSGRESRIGGGGALLPAVEIE